jgi:hypothetical protein
LVHWTGKDIDAAHQPNWYGEPGSKTDTHVTGLYLQRLRDILTYGLWMTEEGPCSFQVGSSRITIPPTPQCCFTELKLSESRRHAGRYGRLGIGVKRPFLFQRLGRPLAYFGFGESSCNDKFLEACAADVSDKRLLNFFKPMNSNIRNLNYDLYSESEWRILLFEELLRSKKIIDPRNPANRAAHDYFCRLSQHEQGRLKYLIPLDGWFAMLIYPSLAVKNGARSNVNYGIADQISRIKSDPNDHGNRVEGGSRPIEIDLDSCRHF